MTSLDEARSSPFLYALVPPLEPARARVVFDRVTRHALHISGDEFLRRWDAGEYAGTEPDSVPATVSRVLPLVRDTAAPADGG